LNLSAGEFPVPPQVIAEVIALIEEGKLNFSVASRQLFPELLKNPNKPASEVAQRLNLIQDSRTESILPIVNQILKEFPLKVEEYQNGKKGLMAMFMGEVMKRSKGKADPKVASELLKEKLEHV
jgi:aspartyl-tRNA(Asn)/glutamyl-tRNA(Gln) amidotransferase subunit B